MLFNKLTHCRCAAALILSLLVTVDSTRAEIRLVGSDLLGPGLDALLEDYARRTGTRLATDFAGSQPGWLQLQDGYADLGVLAFPPGQARPAEPYVCLPLAYHVTFVLVPESLPLGHLSWPSLAGIFGISGAGHVGRWGELGLSGGWTARAVKPRVCEDDGGLSAALFRHLVLQDGDFQPAVVRCENLEALLGDLAPAGAGGIALAPVPPPAGSGLKALADRPHRAGTGRCAHAGERAFRRQCPPLARQPGFSPDGCDPAVPLGAPPVRGGDRA
jgi:phosphate transport system substrate-binding protein